MDRGSALGTDKGREEVAALHEITQDSFTSRTDQQYGRTLGRQSVPPPPSSRRAAQVSSMSGPSRSISSQTHGPPPRAAARQREQLDNATIGTTDLPSRQNHAGEFIVAEHPISGNFLGRDIVGRRAIQHGPPDAPAQEGLAAIPTRRMPAKRRSVVPRWFLCGNAVRRRQLQEEKTTKVRALVARPEGGRHRFRKPR